MNKFRSRGEKIFDALNVCYMLFFAFMILYPFLHLLAIALNDGTDSLRGGLTVYPRVFTLNNFRIALLYPSIKSAALVTVLSTLIGTAFHLAIVLPAAFAVTRKNLVGRRAISTYLIIPNFLTAGMVPSYMIVANLGLLNNFWVYILPMGFSFFSFVIIRSFMMTIPESLEEASVIDGAGYLTIFTRIYLPLCVPGVAAVALFTAVGQWNSWMPSLLYITNKDLVQLQFILQRVIKESITAQIVAQSADGLAAIEGISKPTPDSVRAAVIMVSTLPIVAVYPFLQKYFIQGMVIGAVKG